LRGRRKLTIRLAKNGEKVSPPLAKPTLYDIRYYKDNDYLQNKKGAFMKKALKIVSVATLSVAAGIAAVSTVYGWGDNAGGRPTYSIADINAGKLGDKIVMNSIKDDDSSLTEAERQAGITTPLTDEREFIGIRDAATGNQGKNNVWSIGDVNIEEGKTYIVRMYVHNNSPKGLNAVAKDVTAQVDLPNLVSSEARITGFINASNATPSRYWDSLNLKSADGRRFFLDYIEGSALFENNVWKNGITLSDSLVTSAGVKLGYDKLDGNLPGCYQYSGVVTFKIKPVFENTSIIKQVRMKGDKDWKKAIDAKVGDTVEYRIHYKNLNDGNVANVVVNDSLPNNMEYIKGTTRLIRADIPNGATYNEDKLLTDGVNIGNYAVRGDGYVRFFAKVVDKNLACGNNRLINWAKASANGFAIQDNADVYVNKVCNETPTPTPKPTPTPEPTPTPKELPKTGPETVITGVVGLGAIITSAGYYIASRKQLR
jgi:conserved repeat protein